MRKLTCIVFLMFLTASISVAEDVPRVEVFGGYSMLKLGGDDINELYEEWEHESWSEHNPSTSKWLKTGFMASANFNLNSFFGIEAAFLYNTGTMFEFNWSGDYIVEPMGASSSTYSESGKQKGTLFTVMAGPHFAFRQNKWITPFGHALFGATYASLTAEATCMMAGDDCSAELLDYLLEYEAFVDEQSGAFSMAFGGGVDINVSKHFAIRPIEFDYVITRYSIEEYDVSLNNIVLSFGVVIR